MMVARQGLFIGIITEGADSTMASNKTELDSWITAENAPNTWVFEDPGPRTNGVEGWFARGRDNYIIVDLATMVIDSIQSGESAALSRFYSLLPPPPG